MGNLSISEREMEQQTCRRCGTCCGKGGPTLHREDLDLFLNHVLAPRDIYTIRRGETVYHNVSEELIQTDRELLKIKEGSNGRGCRFFVPSTSTCSIHDRRPLQCRALKCWDTGDIERALATPTLQRNDLLPHDSVITELLRAHDEKCSPAVLQDLAKNFIQYGDELISREILALLHKEATFRRLAAERFTIDPMELDFFFGRPLSVIAKLSGLTISGDAGSPEDSRVM